MARKTSVILDYMEHNTIHTALSEALEVTEDHDDPAQRKVRYREAGQDDKTIAAKLGGRIEEGHVKSFRQKYLGVLYRRGPTIGEGRDRLHARVVALESDVATLVSLLTDLIDGPSSPEHARLMRKYQRGE